MKVGDAVYVKGRGGHLHRVMQVNVETVLLATYPTFDSPFIVHRAHVLTTRRIDELLISGDAPTVEKFLKPPEKIRLSAMSPITAQLFGRSQRDELPDDELETVLKDAEYCANWVSP